MKNIAEFVCHGIRLIPGGGYDHFPINSLEVKKKGFPVIVFHVAGFSLNFFPNEREIGIKFSNAKNHVMICHANFYYTRGGNKIGSIGREVINNRFSCTCFSIRTRFGSYPSEICDELFELKFRVKSFQLSCVTVFWFFVITFSELFVRTFSKPGDLDFSVRKEGEIWPKTRRQSKSLKA